MMNDSLLSRALVVMISPEKTFLDGSKRHNERHVIILSLLFGLLFARQIMHSENRDLFFYVTTALASGIGFVYFAGYFLSWLIKVSGRSMQSTKMRMVLSYAFVPYIIALSLSLLSKAMDLPKATGVIVFMLVVFSWSLAVFGIKTIGELKLVQSLFVMVIPVAALILIISVLFKIAWMTWGY
jgi:4-amino-4-deoxy-L-arabinose transferase-like glycosyltransferase